MFATRVVTTPLVLLVPSDMSQAALAVLSIYMHTDIGKEILRLTYPPTFCLMK